jgi:hypothetical protein
MYIFQSQQTTCSPPLPAQFALHCTLFYTFYNGCAVTVVYTETFSQSLNKKYAAFDRTVTVYL